MWTLKATPSLAIFPVTNNDRMKSFEVGKAQGRLQVSDIK